MSAVDIAVADLASRQFGCFNRSDARRIGFTDKMVQRRLATGAWVRLHPSVFMLRSAADSPELHYFAATLSVPNAVLSGLAAAHLHQLPTCRRVAPQITVRDSAVHRTPSCVVRRRSRFEEARVSGIAATSIAQTLLDITPRLPKRRLVQIFDHAVLRPDVRAGDLEAMVVQARSLRSPGVNEFERLVRDRLSSDGSAESVLELDLHRILEVMVGLPEVRYQVRFPWWKQGRGRFDAVIEEWKLIIEVDGRSWHVRTEAFEDDRQRDALAARNGYLVLRLTAKQLARVDQTVALILDIGSQRRLGR